MFSSKQWPVLSQSVFFVCSLANSVVWITYVPSYKKLFKLSRFILLCGGKHVLCLSCYFLLLKKQQKLHVARLMFHFESGTATQSILWLLAVVIHIHPTQSIAVFSVPLELRKT